MRYGRVPKRSKSQEDQSVSSTDSSQEQSALESRQLAIYDVILSISQAHHAHCAVTDDKIKGIPRKAATLVSSICVHVCVCTCVCVCVCVLERKREREKMGHQIRLFKLLAANAMAFELGHRT